MAKVNVVLEGQYKGKKVQLMKWKNDSWLEIDGGLNKHSVKSYTVIDETNKDQYSFWKGALGVALLGGLGAVAGIGGKNKKEFLIAIEWKDGEKSLILIDDECYRVFVQSMF